MWLTEITQPEWTSLGLEARPGWLHSASSLSIFLASGYHPKPRLPDFQGQVQRHNIGFRSVCQSHTIEDFTKCQMCTHTYMHKWINVVCSLKRKLWNLSTAIWISFMVANLPLKVYLIFGNGRKSFGACDIVIYNKMLCLVFVPSPWHRVPKTFGKS